MTKYIKIELKQEKAVLIGVINQHQDGRQVEDYLNELEFLTETAGAIAIKKFTQKLDRPDSKTFVGRGKLAEIAAFIKDNEIDLVIFDDELSGSQIKNIETELECKIVDRTNLILDIFAKRAQTSYAKKQVQLAQYEYLLPRLTGMWKHLERQRGGIGMRGPGERELETDRRIIRDRISLLKEQLTKIDRQMTTQRKGRGNFVRVALVGYTNVGKSTIMNLLAKSEVFAEDKLFATVDTTVRKVVIGNLPFLMSDTVGFIRKLPTQLIESFKSTLDEVREADILLHVADISHPNVQEQVEVVQRTLNELGASTQKNILVFNKIDAYTYIKKDEDDLTPKTDQNYDLEELKSLWIAKENIPCIFISALKKDNIQLFKDMVYQYVKEIHIARYPYDNLLY
jgi:GTP-binding protein HflX